MSFLAHAVFNGTEPTVVVEDEEDGKEAFEDDTGIALEAGDNGTLPDLRSSSLASSRKYLRRSFSTIFLSPENCEEKHASIKSSVLTD